MQARSGHRASADLSNFAGDAYERPTRLAKRFCRATGAFVGIVDADRLRLRSLSSDALRLLVDGEIMFNEQVRSTIASSAMVEDGTKETSFSAHPAVAAFGAGSFLSSPLLGSALGCICVFDTAARSWTPDEVDLVAELAQSISASIDRRVRRQAPHRRAQSSDRLVQAKLPAALVVTSAAPPQEALLHGELLKAIAVAANEATTRLEALRSSLECVCTHMGWRVGHCYLVSCGRLVPLSLWHLADSARYRPFQEASEVSALASDRGLVARALQTRRASWSDDLSSDLPFLRATVAGRAGLRCGFAFPLLVQSEVVAVLEFYSDDSTRPSETVLSLMAEVATQLGRVFEREKARSMLEEHAEQVRAKSRTDELTGLRNRRGFFEEGPEKLRSMRGDGACVALLFVDLNGMKLINDQFGHENGDRALVDMADALRETFQSADLVARLGGDEFAILASRQTADEVKGLAVRLQAEIDALNTTRHRPYKLSASVGVACEDEQSESFEELLFRADSLMYQQKRKLTARP